MAEWGYFEKVLLPDAHTNTQTKRILSSDSEVDVGSVPQRKIARAGILYGTRPHGTPRRRQDPACLEFAGAVLAPCATVRVWLRLFDGPGERPAAMDADAELA